MPLYNYKRKTLTFSIDLFFCIHLQFCMSDIKLKELLSFILIHVSISFCLDMGNTGDKKNNWDGNFFSHAYLKYYVLSLVCIQITTFSV